MFCLLEGTMTTWHQSRESVLIQRLAEPVPTLFAFYSIFVAGGVMSCLYLCPDVSHGEPFLLRGSGVAGSRGFSPTALIFSFNWPAEEERRLKQERLWTKPTVKAHSSTFQPDVCRGISSSWNPNPVINKFNPVINLWLPAAATIIQLSWSHFIYQFNDWLIDCWENVYATSQRP